MATKKHRDVRIGIDGGAYDPHRGVKNGIERLMAGFLGSVSAFSRGKQPLFYGFAAPKGSLGAGIAARKLPARFFSSLFLPLSILSDSCDICLAFSGVIPPFLRFFKKKSIVFIHDFAFLDHPENYGDPERMKWQTEYALFGADRVVVFSDYIKSQAYARYPTLPSGKVVRIYPGADHLGAAAKAGPDRDNPYFLYVGVIKPAKNILVLLSRFEKYIRFNNDKKTKLILAGPQEDAYFRSVKDTLVYRKLGPRIEFRDNADDAELARLYRGSLALLNVSHDEGFCYPVVEALTLGRPAIVNDLPLYREFRPYFPALTVTGSEEEFIGALHKAADGSIAGTAKKSPFAWRAFTGELMHEIDSLTL